MPSWTSNPSSGAVDWSLLKAGPAISDRLASDLTRMIRSGSLVAGDRIPAERELAQRVGMSRASVREALRELELRGLVDRRPGRGTVVVDVPRPDLDAGLLGTLDQAGRMLREVMDLRLLVEPPISERAAARGTALEIEQLGELLDEGRRTADQGPRKVLRYVELDVEFHLTLARMTHNPLLDRLLTVTHEWMAPSRRSTLQSAHRIALSLSAHQAIFEAVSTRDPDGAGAAMKLHLEQIQRLISTPAH